MAISLPEFREKRHQADAWLGLMAAVYDGAGGIAAGCHR